MSWNQVVLTKVGEELISGMLNGAKLIITRAVIGDKTVSEAQLPIQTGVFSPLSAPALISGQEEVAGKNGTQIDIQIRNEGVLETSRMKQVGIFAKTEHHDEVLLGILQDEIGEEIPAYSDFPEWLIRLSVIIGISRTNNINVIVSPHVFATAAELEALKALFYKYGLVEVSTAERSPDKPTYGIDDSGGRVQANLRATTYTGMADVTLILGDGTMYDAENVKRDASVALNGDLIIKED